MNVAPAGPGAPFVFVSNEQTLSKLTAKRAKGPISTFLYFNRNDWRYYGDYEEAWRGFITGEEIRAASAADKERWKELFGSHLKVKPKEGAVVGEHTMIPWGFRAQTATQAMAQIERGDVICIGVTVRRCVRFNEVGLAEWMEKRRNRK